MAFINEGDVDLIGKKYLNDVLVDTISVVVQDGTQGGWTLIHDVDVFAGDVVKVELYFGTTLLDSREETYCASAAAGQVGSAQECGEGVTMAFINEGDVDLIGKKYLNDVLVDTISVVVQDGTQGGWTLIHDVDVFAGDVVKVELYFGTTLLDSREETYVGQC